MAVCKLKTENATCSPCSRCVLSAAKQGCSITRYPSSHLPRETRLPHRKSALQNFAGGVKANCHASLNLLTPQFATQVTGAILHPELLLIFLNTIKQAPEIIDHLEVQFISEPATGRRNRVTICQSLKLTYA